DDIFNFNETLQSLPFWKHYSIVPRVSLVVKSNVQQSKGRRFESVRARAGGPRFSGAARAPKTEQSKPVITALKLASPQHYVRRPEQINAVEYKREMKIRGTKFSQRNLVWEVTDNVRDISDGNVGGRFFLVANSRTRADESDEERLESIDTYLRGVLFDDLPP
ncbi:hypothetical protein FOL47_002439, partial [Perkinsus chesapeaki]